MFLFSFYKIRFKNSFVKFKQSKKCLTKLLSKHFNYNNVINEKFDIYFLK